MKRFGRVPVIGGVPLLRRSSAGVGPAPVAVGTASAKQWHTCNGLPGAPGSDSSRRSDHDEDLASILPKVPKKSCVPSLPFAVGRRDGRASCPFGVLSLPPPAVEGQA